MDPAGANNSSIILSPNKNRETRNRFLAILSQFIDKRIITQLPGKFQYFGGIFKKI